MSTEKLKPAREQGRPAPSQSVPAPRVKPPTPPLFRKIDWLSLAVTALLVFIGYFLTLAPDLTLEDSGELATGSFTRACHIRPAIRSGRFSPTCSPRSFLIRTSPGAWGWLRPVAGALACGLIALIASRAAA